MDENLRDKRKKGERERKNEGKMIQSGRTQTCRLLEKLKELFYLEN